MKLIFISALFWALCVNAAPSMDVIRKRDQSQASKSRFQRLKSLFSTRRPSSSGGDTPTVHDDDSQSTVSSTLSFSAFIDEFDPEIIIRDDSYDWKDVSPTQFTAGELDILLYFTAKMKLQHSFEALFKLRDKVKGKNKSTARFYKHAIMMNPRPLINEIMTEARQVKSEQIHSHPTENGNFDFRMTHEDPHYHALATIPHEDISLLFKHHPREMENMIQNLFENEKFGPFFSFMELVNQFENAPCSLLVKLIPKMDHLLDSTRKWEYLSSKCTPIELKERFPLALKQLASLRDPGVIMLLISSAMDKQNDRNEEREKMKKILLFSLEKLEDDERTPVVKAMKKLGIAVSDSEMKNSQAAKYVHEGCLFPLITSTTGKPKIVEICFINSSGKVVQESHIDLTTPYNLRSTPTIKTMEEFFQGVRDLEVTDANIENLRRIFEAHAITFTTLKLGVSESDMAEYGVPGGLRKAIMAVMRRMY